MRFGLDVPVDGPYADPRLLARLAGEAERAGWDGVYLMTTNQDTGGPLTPADITEATWFLRAQRGDETSGEVAVNPAPDATVETYAAAGATWWLELAPDGGPDAYLERIRKGPPSS